MILLLGMELMANKFQVIVTSMRKKPYNCIDQRKMEFDTDFDEFKRQIVDLHVRSSTFFSFFLYGEHSFF